MEIEDKKDRNIYSLNLICYLRLHSFDEKEVGFNDNTGKVYYIFEYSDELIKTIGDYRDRETLVNLHGFITEFRGLKEEVWEHSRGFKDE